jgi:selenide,water dikinase
VVVGPHSSDDAGVFKISPDVALVQTVDFITPVVDDPFDYGAIAAANSLSDVYAMGGRPLTALNLLGSPGGVVTNDVLRRILEGGLATIGEAKAVVVGGHSVKTPELFYGVAVTGVVHPDRVVTNSGARPGAVLVLTKRLGVGILTTALKNENLPDELLPVIVTQMRTLNAAAAEAMVEVGVQACTDVTGFGLLGHLFELVESSGVTAEVEVASVPYFLEAVELARQGNVAGGLKANRTYLEPHVTVAPQVSDDVEPLLYDPQTSGGLLIAVAEERLPALLDALERRGVETRAVIGRILERSDKAIILRP